MEIASLPPMAGVQGPGIGLKKASQGASLGARFFRLKPWLGECQSEYRNEINLRSLLIFVITLQIPYDEVWKKIIPQRDRNIT